MNKEQQQIIDEVYETYKTIHKHDIRTEGDRSQLAIESLEKQLIYPQEEFINKCKTDTEFSEKWGLKIEERIVLEQVDQTNPTLKGSTALYSRKLITLTYKNETIESYE